MSLPENLGNPVRFVRHAELTRCHPGKLDSDCPVCVKGVLTMRRDMTTFRLEAWGHCLLCGQLFVYTDIDEVRKTDWAKCYPPGRGN